MNDLTQEEEERLMTLQRRIEFLNLEEIIYLRRGKIGWKEAVKLYIKVLTKQDAVVD